MIVVKRDESQQSYCFDKVKNAVKKAFNSVEQEVPNKFFEQLEESINQFNKEKITVEELQDIIQKELIKRNKYDVVESFILYRKKRAEIREQKSDLILEVQKKLKASDVQNQNANVDEHSFGGRIGEAARVVCKNDALKNVMSKKSRRNHESNEIYIHDLDSYSAGEHNCLTIPFDDLLAKGFKTRQVDIRPAGSVNTAMQLVAVIFQIQSLQQFGGASASHIDWTMVPYVRKSFRKHYLSEHIKTLDEFYYLDILSLKYDDFNHWIANKITEFYIQHPDLEDESVWKFSNYSLFNGKLYQRALFETKKETYQAVEGMYHNLNSLQSRSGNQLPFSSLNYGTCTELEGRMVTKALLEVSIDGLGPAHTTSIFPCGIFQYMKGVNDKPGTPNYDLKRLALKSTSRRIYPNYANVDWSGNAGYDRNDPRTYFCTMGCRTANSFDINGFGQLKDGRGNICPTTIILPTLAMETLERKFKGITNDYSEMVRLAHQNKEDVIKSFMAYLDKKIHEAKDMLIERFNHIANQPASSATFMYENGIMAGYVPEEGIISALKHGTLAIGELALAETLEILIGTNHVHEEGMELAKKIESLFQKRCKEFKEEYRLNFGVYYTPAENLCFTAMKNFRKKYGILKNISDRDYFTNSIHVPVWEKVTSFQKIDIESKLTGYSSAGCITYTELPDGTKNNIDAMETLVDYAMDHDIPYFAINIPLDTCMDCGYTGEFDVCPICHSNKVKRLRRITGYLSSDVNHFNPGKKAEESDRIKHTDNKINEENCL